MTAGKDRWLMERHLKNPNMKFVVNDMAPQCEVERFNSRSTPETLFMPSKFRHNKQKVKNRNSNADGTVINKNNKYKLNRLSKQQFEKTKERLGNNRFYALQYRKRHGVEHEPVKKAEVLELVKGINALTVDNFKPIKKDVMGLFKQIEKKEERRKDHFKNLRGIRAQAGEEYFSDGDSDSIVWQDGNFNLLQMSENKFNFIYFIGDEKFIHLLTFPSKYYKEVSDRISLILSFKKDSDTVNISMINAYLADIIRADNCIRQTARVAENNPSPVMEFFAKLTACPHCLPHVKCATCFEDPTDCVLSHHVKRILSDLSIAFVQMYINRNITTFFAEILRIFGTMTGQCLLDMDIKKMFYTTVYEAMTLHSKAISHVFEFLSTDRIKDYESMVEWFVALFKKSKEENVPQSASAWMETDLFKLVTNWWAYILYMVVSKGKCAKYPFLGDILEATRKEGAKLSTDILKFTITSIEFALKKGRQWQQFGFRPTFYHGKASYLAIVVRFDEVKAKYGCKNNPEIYDNMDYDNFVSELLTLRREVGEMVKCCPIKLKEKVQAMYLQLVMMSNDVTSDENVLRNRDAPYGTLIWGNTSIGKSTFKDICNKLLCDVHGKKFEAKYIYTKNGDKRSDGYKSHMHTIVLDDVGAKHPNKCPMGDPMVYLLIDISNNVAHITEQARAEDKGKIPVWSKFLFVTANTDHLNTASYMTYPAAVMRRFNLVVHLSIKDRYATNGMLDPTKLNGEKYNLWNIKVGDFRPSSTDNSTGKIVYTHIFTNIFKFLEYMGPDSIRHFENQKTRDDTMKDFGNFTFNKLGLLENGESALYEETEEDLQFYLDNNAEPPKKEQDIELQERLELSQVYQKYGLLSQYPECDGIIDNEDPRKQEYDKVISDIKFKYERLKYVNQNIHAPQGMNDYLPHKLAFSALKFGSKYIQDLYTLENIFSVANSASSTGETSLGCIRRLLLSAAETTGNMEDKLRTVRAVTGIGCKYTVASKLPFFNVNTFAMKEIVNIAFPEDDSITNFCIKLTAFLATVFIGYKLTQKLIAPPIVQKNAFIDVVLPRQSTSETDHQMNTQEAQGAIMTKDTTQFWVDNANVLKDVDVGASSIYYKGKIQQALDHIARNTVLLICKTDHGTSYDIRAFCIAGYTYVANYHVVKRYNIVELTIIHDKSDSANYNITMSYDFSETYDDESNDLCFFQLPGVRPKKRLLNLFARGNLNDTVFNGCYLARQKDGSIIQKVVCDIHPSKDLIKFTTGVREIRVFAGTVHTPTQDGDCGMPMIGFTHYGPVILGIHISGRESVCGSVPVNVDMILRSNFSLHPDLTPTKVVFEDKMKTLIPERLISHPSFLPPDATLLRLGSVKNSYIKSTTAVVRTDMAPHFESIGFKQLKTAPPMNDWRIYKSNIEAMTQKKVIINQKDLNMCVNTYLNHLFEIDKSEFDMLGTIEDSVNINGMPGVDYIESINRNTSMGFPFNTTKKKYLISCPTEIHPDGVTFTDEIWNEFIRQDYLARCGFMTQNIYQTSEKDEPITFKKADEYGTRLFFGAPVPTVLVIRKYDLPIVRFFQRNRIKSGVMIGTVTQSYQWEELYDSLPWHDRIMAGDFSKFDKKQNVLILAAAFDVINGIAKHSGKYSEVDLRAMDSIKADTCFACMNFDGDLLSFLGTLASGTPLTTLINSICVKLIHMYVFLQACPQHVLDKYFEWVFDREYGDDSIVSVSPKCIFLNHITMARECEKIGLKYTMADKDAELVPFIHINEATFLKRRFVRDKETNIIMAPLDPDNMVNSLMVWVRSKNLTPDEQACMSMQSSIREWFFHGRDKFDEFSLIYKDIYRTVYHKDIHFPNFDDVLSNFHSHDIKEPQGGLEYVGYSMYPKFSGDLIPSRYYKRSSFMVRLFFDKLCCCPILCEDVYVFVYKYLFGVCRICGRIVKDKRLCEYHFVLLEQNFLFHSLNSHYKVCLACGIFFHQDPSWNWISGLCACCIARYVCGLCKVKQLCSNHLCIAYPHRHFLSYSIANNIVDSSVGTPKRTQSWLQLFARYHYID